MSLRYPALQAEDNSVNEAQVLLVEYDDAQFVNGFKLIDGFNVTFDIDEIGRSLTINAVSDGATGGAPTNASFITRSSEGGLSNEGVWTDGSGIASSFSAPTFTVSVSTAIRDAAYLTWDANDTILTDKKVLQFEGGITYRLESGALVISTSAKQDHDAKLDAFSSFDGVGIVVQTAPDTFAARSIAVNTSQLAISNPAGTAGDPTLAIATNPTFPGNAYCLLPSGGTAARPGSPVPGYFRYNSDVSKVEYYNGSGWIQLEAVDGIGFYNTVQNGGSGLTQRQILNITGNGIQAVDNTTKTDVSLTGTLPNLSQFNSDGYLVQTAQNTFVSRQITNVANQTSGTNPAGLSGNTVIGLADNAIFPGHAAVTLPSGDTSERPGSPNNGMIRMNYETGRIEAREGGAWINLSNINDQPLDSDLTSIAALSGTGYATRTGSGTWANRTFQGTSNRITISNPAGVAGDSTFDVGTDVYTVGGTDVAIADGGTGASVAATALSNLGGQPLDADLTTLAGLSTTGYAIRTGSGTWTTRSLTVDTSNLAITNADGVSGATLLRIGNNATFPGNAAVLLPSGGDSDRPGSPVGGNFRYNSQAGKVEYYNGAGWIQLAASGGSSGHVIQEEGSNLTARTNLNFVGAAATATDDSGNDATVISFDAYLNSLAALSTNGLVVYNSGSALGRSIVGTTNQIGVANQDATAGNPTVSLASNAIFPGHAAVTLPSGDTSERPTATGGEVRFNYQTFKLEGYEGSWKNLIDDTLYQSLDADLTAIAALSGTGYAVRTASNTWANRSITTTSTQLSLSSGDGVSGNTLLGIATNPILPGNAYCLLPSGATVDRPGSPIAGYFRYNSDLNKAEYYNGSGWIQVEAADGVGYDRIQEEGSDLTKRATLNIVGSALTATDTGAKTQLASHAQVNSLADLSSNGAVFRTASNTLTARTHIGTSGRLVVTDGDGIAGNPTYDVGSNVYTVGGTDVAIADGGTGISTTPSNGQLLIGNGSGYSLANLTAGNNVKITNGSGTITLQILAATISASANSPVNLSSTSDSVEYANTVDGNVVFNLPALSTVLDKAFIFKKINAASTMTVSGHWDEVIESANTYSITDNNSFIIIHADTVSNKWRIIGRSYTLSELGGQPLDSTLTALAALDGTAGYMAVTGADTFVRRTLTGTSNRITITNTTGGGNPVFDVGTDVYTVGGTDVAIADGGTGASVAATALSNLGGQPLDATLTALAAYNTTAFVVQTAPDTFAGRTFADVSNQTTWTNPAGTAGNPSVSIASNAVLPGTGGVVLPTGTTAQQGSTNGGARYNSDNTEVEFRENGTWNPKQTKDATLTALAALNTTAGMVVQTGTDTFTKRTLTGTANRLVITDGDGVAGTPTFDVGSNVYTVGGTDVAVVDGGLGISTVPSNGFLPIGNGTNYTAATLTAGNNVEITNASGSITIQAYSTTISANSDSPVTLTATSNRTRLANTASGSITYNLPAISGAANKVFIFKKINASNTVTISRNGSDTIEGSTSYTLTANNDWVVLVADNTNNIWRIVGRSYITVTDFQAPDADLTAIAAFSSTGFAARTATDTWAQRSFADTTNQIVWTNPAGVAGNPTAAIADNVVLPGTSSFIPPAGTTAQRPANSAGKTRYNTDDNKLEYNTGSAWVQLTTSGGGSAHTIQENGSNLTARTGLNFSTGLLATDNSGSDRTDITLETNLTLPGSAGFIPPSGNTAARGSTLAQVRYNTTLSTLEYLGLGGIDGNTNQWFSAPGQQYSAVSAAATGTYNTTHKVDVSSAGFTFKIPTAVGHEGKKVKVKIGATTNGNTLTISFLMGQNSDGVTSITSTTPFDEWCFESDGANWMIVGG